MQFDQARIAIRERSWLDNLDLALQVIRTHFKAVCVLAAWGVLPLVAMNYAMLYVLLSGDLSEEATFEMVWWSLVAVLFEAPLATAPVTLYLGQALFDAHPSGRKVARDLLACLPQLFLFQFLLRGLLFVMVLSAVIPYALWPYLNEVILLERNPLSARGGQLSTMKRSSVLHRGKSGDYIARGLAAAFFGGLLVVALYVTQSMVLRVLFGVSEGWTARVLALQGVLWIVAVFFTVVRFLSYLDQRIRSEGWEVELFLRAQRERMMRHAA
ncbi:MAG: hypothetical protein DWQ37_22455 [Planctomycetota bacterium]|nr:MAG: hypothetical protein DWQ37_22455 [Planctomycetota bacterium]